MQPDKVEMIQETALQNTK